VGGDLTGSEGGENMAKIGIDDMIKHISIAEEAAWGTGSGKTTYMFKTKEHILEVTGTVIEPSYECFRPAFIFKEDGALLYEEGSVNVEAYHNESVMRGIYKDSKSLFAYLKAKYVNDTFTEIL